MEFFLNFSGNSSFVTIIVSTKYLYRYIYIYSISYTVSPEYLHWHRCVYDKRQCVPSYDNFRNTCPNYNLNASIPRISGMRILEAQRSFAQCVEIITTCPRLVVIFVIHVCSNFDPNHSVKQGNDQSLASTHPLRWKNNWFRLIDIGEKIWVKMAHF